MRVEVCEDEVDRGVVFFVGGVQGVIEVVVVVVGSVGIFPAWGGCCVVLNVVVLLDGFEFQSSIDFALELWGGSAGAGAEVNEGVVFD